MFAVVERTIDQARERRRASRRREVLEIRARHARDYQRLTVLTREAHDDGDWQDAGCTSGAQWLAQITSSDYRTAKRITDTAEALRELPELDAALGAGELTLDQVASAAPLATPATDAELARFAVGKAPCEIAREARKLVPPKIADDKELYARRALSMNWTRDRRELVFSGRLPLEQGVAFEQAIWDTAKQRRAADKEHGSVLAWPQYTADALLTLTTQRTDAGRDGVKRSRTTCVVHLSADEPPILEGSGPISVETAERLICDSRRIVIKRHGYDLVHSRVERCASEAQLWAMYKRADGHCQYPGCTVTRELEACHLLAHEDGGKAILENMILLCSRHHDYVHERHVHTGGNGDHPTFTDANGRTITTNQQHAPPAD